MRLVTYCVAGSSPVPGVVVDGKVINVTPAGFTDTLAVIRGGAAAQAEIKSYIKVVPPAAQLPLEQAVLLAPIPRPPKFICIGLNYLDHAKESNLEVPKVPTVFSKFSNTVIAPGAPIVLPAVSKAPDYEAEFAVIIGEGGRHIKAEDWQKHVYGYTCVNDVSARDYQTMTSQWLMGKTFDSFAPMGPYITTADEIEDPHNLDIACIINGETLQDSNTKHLIFKLPTLIEFLSSVFTLEPGDVISTGTPAGVGFARNPKRFLKPGDDVTIRIQGLGELRNPVIAEE